ncbi:MAG TPA: alpha/beta hydrolase [Candidatus Limnocylindrales bacterium]|nr:alpha/beta hydrolase [Candidatus Limnocylindrales bacterium]
MTSADGTRIAVFGSGVGPPLVLVHGASADHTTFRVVGPMLARAFTVHAIDRRGRGASGDGPAYSIEREFEDVAAVAGAVAADADAPVGVFGHSYGGRCALGAALLTDAIGHVISYEGAPAPPGASYRAPGAEDRVRDLLAVGDRDGALTAFLREVIGMSEVDLAAYRADPIWPVRAAAAGTILRELEAESEPAASLERLGAVVQPVTQLLGSESLPVFRDATVALEERLARGRIVVIDGARHAAHHTHPDVVVRAVRESAHA